MDPNGIYQIYFNVKMLAPKEKLNMMKTFNYMNPLNSNLNEAIIDRFLNQQQDMLKIIEMAKIKNLNKVKTSISISKLMKLKLGDTLRVVIYHNKRHIIQANKIVH